MCVANVRLALRHQAVRETGASPRDGGQLDRCSVALLDEQRELLEALRATGVPYEVRRAASPDQRQRTDDEVARTRERSRKRGTRLGRTALDGAARALAAPIDGPGRAGGRREGRTTT